MRGVKPGALFLALAACAPGGPTDGTPPDTDQGESSDTDSPAETDGAPDTDAPAETDGEPDTDGATETDTPPDTDTDPPPDTDTDTDTGPPPLPACPAFRPATRAGTTPLFVVTEASGIAASRRNRNVLWLHNDSGSGPSVHAITPSLTGGLLGTFTLDGANANDWEDIAVGPGPTVGTTYLYVADIGDNGRSRSTVQIYRVAEPAVSATGGVAQGRTLNGIETIELAYPDRAHDAETMMVDPLTGDLYIVVKDGSGESPVFRARAPLATSGVTTLELVTTLQFGTALLAGDDLATGGDISVAGDEIAIRTYDSAFLWRRPPGTTVDEALATDPCPIPQASEGQGEAIGFSATGPGYYTVGEGSATWVNFYRRR